MAVKTTPEQQKIQKKVEAVIPALDSAIDKVNGLETCYKKAADTAESFSTNREFGNTNVPWNISSNVFEKRNAFEYIYSEPLQTIMSGSVNPSNSTIEGFARSVRYDQIFINHQHFIKGPGSSLSNLLTEARTNLDTFNVSNYQSNLTNAKRLLVNQMIEPVRIFIRSLKVTDEQITNPQSLFYKSNGSYGVSATFDPETISNFSMGSEMDSLKQQAGEIFTKLRDLFNVIDELSKIKEDILKRVVLSNQGFQEDPTQPGTFVKGTEDKEGWGIKFSYRKSLNSNQFIRTTGQNDALNNSLTQTRSRDSNRQQALNNRTILENSNFINDTNLGVDKYFYMQLLPAIKSNLPVQGGVDVPGAMPGLQFRIENNIVKHKIPGFAPIYQPLGIDCIKCTLVGLFTGHDGVSIDSTLREDLIVSTRSQSLANQTPGEVPKVIPFDIVNQAKEGYQDRPFTRTGGLETNNSSGGLWDHIPNLNNTTGAVSMTYDAFMNAQEFYNEIVSSGVEVEVEINTRSRSGGQPGGAGGPFRDKETGNPKFKALIKRMDMYYVRQDRVYYILDLLITNSGLIGDECINLTNVIEEATDLFESTEVEQQIATVKELRECFGDNALEFDLTGAERGKLVINRKTGESFRARGDTFLPGAVYPTAAVETFRFIIQNYNDTNVIKGSEKKKIRALRDIIRYGHSNLKTTSNQNGRNLTVNKMYMDRTFSGDSRIKLDKTSGTWFVVYQDDTPVLFRGEEQVFNFTVGLDYMLLGPSRVPFGGREDTVALFNELIPLLEFNKPGCASTIPSLSEEQNTQTPASEEPTNFTIEDIPLLEDVINGTNSNTNNPPRPITAESRGRFERENSSEVREITSGSLNPSLIKGINDYLNLISKDENTTPITESSILRTDLINTIKRNTQFYSEETGNVNAINIESAISSQGASELIDVELTSNVNSGSDFIVKSGTTTQVFPGITNTTFNIQLATYVDNNKTSYKIKSINIKDPYAGSAPTAKVVPSASDALNPGDTNTPSKP